VVKIIKRHKENQILFSQNHKSCLHSENTCNIIIYVFKLHKLLYYKLLRGFSRHQFFEHYRTGEVSFLQPSLENCMSVFVIFQCFFLDSADARLLEEATEPICQKLGEYRNNSSSCS